MRYLVTACVKPGKELALLEAIQSCTVGAGSVAGDEYLRNMRQARVHEDGRIQWVEICFCQLPLEERRYWEEFFDLTRIHDAHARSRCRDFNGSEPWACCSCDCTVKLETKLARSGDEFLQTLTVLVRPDG